MRKQNKTVDNKRAARAHFTVQIVATNSDTYHFVRPHGEEVGHQSGKAGSKATLGDEAKFQLGQAHGVVASLPVPARNVEQVRLTHSTSLISLNSRNIYLVASHASNTGWQYTL